MAVSFASRVKREQAIERFRKSLTTLHQLRVIIIDTITLGTLDLSRVLDPKSSAFGMLYAEAVKRPHALASPELYIPA